MNNLLVGNVDRALAMGSPQQELSVAQMAACVAQSAGLLWQCSVGDAVLLARSPSEAFLSYVERTRGFRPTVYVPSEASFVGAGCLTEAAMRDEVLVSMLTQKGAEAFWGIKPFVQDPSVHELAERVGIGVIGMRAEDVRCGWAVRFNDTEVFQAACGSLGIGTPYSTRVASGDILGLRHAVQRIYVKGGSTVVRRVIAGGFDVLKIAYRDCVADFESALVPASLLLAGGDVLVEPCYVCNVAATVLMRIVDGVVQPVGIVTKDVNDRRPSMGGTLPSDIDEAIAQHLIAQSVRYAVTVAGKIVDGDLDFDWGVDVNDQGVPLCAAFASTCRMTAAHPIVSLWQQFSTEDEPVFCWHREDLRVDDATFDDVLRLFDHLELLWSGSDGAIIVTPPHGGMMSVAVFAKTLERRDFFRAGVLRHAEHIKKKLTLM